MPSLRLGAETPWLGPPAGLSGRNRSYGEGTVFPETLPRKEKEEGLSPGLSLPSAL